MSSLTSQGQPGLLGESGPSGPEGPQGGLGPRGPKGEMGHVGRKGPSGPKGDKVCVYVFIVHVLLNNIHAQTHTQRHSHTFGDTGVS